MKLAVISAIDITFKVLLIAQIKAAQEAGYEIYGICSAGPNFDFLEQEGIKMHPIKIKRSISPFSDLAALWKMYRFFKKENINIVHTHTPKCSLLGQLAAKLAGIPVIVNTVHGFYFHEHMKPLARRFYIAMEWIAGKCSTVVLSQNPEDIDTAIKLKICKPDKIRLLGNGVDLGKFNPDRFDDSFKKQKRKELAIPESATVIGIIGRLVQEKGYLELFEAFREIIKKRDNTWLVMIGSEEPKKADRISADTFKAYGIEERTCWLGNRDDIPELLACIDIYTLPSWREGFPRSAIEASAMSLPIVTTNIRGCRQVVDDNINGILVPLKDVEKLQQAILKLIEEPELRQTMGWAGYEKAQTEFDEQKVCEIVINSYVELLDNKNAHK